MKGAARIRKNGAAIIRPTKTAAQSIVKIVLFRQDMVPSPYVEGLALVRLVLNMGRYRAQRSDDRHKKVEFFEKTGRITGFGACRPGGLTQRRAQT